MNDPVDELAQRGMALSIEERSRLIDLLLESLNEPTIAELAGAWGHEIERRLAEYDGGEGKSIAADDARPCQVIQARFLPPAEAEFLSEVDWSVRVKGSQKRL